jgi:hypothetical protein
LRTESLQTGETEEEEIPVVQAPRAEKRKAGGFSEFPLELAEEMRTSTTADIEVELFPRASVVTKVAQTFRNLKGMYVKMLREDIAAGGTREPRRLRDKGRTRGDVGGGERGAPKRGGPTGSTAEKNGESARLAALKRKMEKLGTLLTKLAEERLQDIDRWSEKEVISDKTTIRVETRVSNTPVTKGGEASCYHGTADRRKKEKEDTRKAPERRSENAGRRGNKLPPHAHHEYGR